MPYVEVWVDPAEVDLSEVDEKSSMDELDRRRRISKKAVAGGYGDNGATLEEVFEYFHIHGNAPKVLRDYIWGALGRVL